MVANIGQLKQVFDFDLVSPMPVTGFTVTAGATAAYLNWTPPPIDGSGYLIVQASTDGGATWTTISTTEYDVDDPPLSGTMVPYSGSSPTSTSYRVVDSSTDSASDGVASAAVTITPAPAPPPRYARH